MTSAEFDAWAAAEVDAVESALHAWVPSDAPAGLGLAMRYGVLDGGKRVRPLLVLAAAEAVRGLREAALRAACAVELIHAYSLVHDDMPCMDNDILRRGKPTVHVQFGDAQAMLAGDAMQARPRGAHSLQRCSAALQARLCGLLARLAAMPAWPAVRRRPAASACNSRSHTAFSTIARPCIAAGERLDGRGLRQGDGGPSGPRCRTTAMLLGLAFQVVDDILDVTQARRSSARPRART